MASVAKSLSLVQPDGRPSRLIQYELNVLAAALWGVMAYFSIWSGWTAHDFSRKSLFLAALAIRNCSFPILFLIRRPAKVTSKHLKDWVVPFIGIVIGFFYNSNASYSLVAADSQGMIYFFLTIAIILSLAANLSLGRSFGIVPANRGIKTTGLYALVRHPIYAGYIIFDLLFVTLRLSWYNVLICLIFLSTIYLRAHYEERLLRQDPVYLAYSQQTRYMFFPGIL